MNFIPFVDMENFFTLYNCQIKINNSKNAWSYYFKQVSKFKIADIYKSQNVIICDNKTKNIADILISEKLAYRYEGGTKLTDEQQKQEIK